MQCNGVAPNRPSMLSAPKCQASFSNLSFFVLLLQRATLAEKEVSNLKEQLSGTNPSSTPTTTTSTNQLLSPSSTTTITQNGVGGCLARQSLGSPTMSDCSSSGGAVSASNQLISSKLLNNNKLDEVNENKLNEASEQMANSCDSNRSTPISMADKRDACANNDDDDDEDDDDVVQLSEPKAAASSAPPLSGLTNSIIGSTTMTTTTTSNVINTSAKTKSNDGRDNDGDCDDISAKDKEVSGSISDES